MAGAGKIVVAVARTLKATPERRGSLEETAAAVRERGGIAIAAATDVRDETQVRAMVKRVLEQYGRIDVLVNNAGIMIGDRRFIDTPPELWREVLDTNLWGAYLCCRAIVPTMAHQHHGVIINITSGAAVRPGFLNLPYGVSKAGLDRLTLGLGWEFKDRHIACVALSPPVSATDTVRRMYPDRPVDTWAQPPELTSLAVNTLLEDDPMQYTGQVLSVREYLRRRGLLE
jgi:3-oxoacyl-[acyl-carrier protein] reductase